MGVSEKKMIVQETSVEKISREILFYPSRPPKVHPDERKGDRVDRGRSRRGKSRNVDKDSSDVDRVHSRRNKSRNVDKNRN